MASLLFSSVLLFTSFTSALPASIHDTASRGLTISARDSSAGARNFITTAPDYIALALSVSDTSCSSLGILPILCGAHTSDESQDDEMANRSDSSTEGRVCGSGFEGWLCSVMTHTSLIAFVFLIFAPLLALGIYKWKKSKKQLKKTPLPLNEPLDGYSQVEEIRSRWMPMSPL